MPKNESKAPRLDAGKKPSRPEPVKKPVFPQQRNTFNLGGRRFNGQSMRRGTRH